MNEPTPHTAATPTPRTDAEIFDATPESEDLEPLLDCVTADFARTLERELAQAVAERDAHRETIRQVIEAAKWDGLIGIPEIIQSLQHELNNVWRPAAAMNERYAREYKAERDTALAQVTKLREALERLRDCDWVITPHDRMDGVRDIARAALAATKGAE